MEEFIINREFPVKGVICNEKGQSIGEYILYDEGQVLGEFILYEKDSSQSLENCETGCD